MKKYLFLILALFIASLSPVEVCFAYISQSNSIANFVIGQANMTTGDANQGGAISANGLDNPLGVSVYNSKMYIAEENNNRVLIYNSIPTSNNPTANVVIGQANMMSGLANQGGAVAANTLDSPRQAYVYGSKLFVVDRDNHRVLIYNSIPASDNASANVVIGQPNMTSNSPNQGGAVAANTLRSPRSVLVVGGKLIISDCNNHRVLIFNSIPTSDDASADVVIGQPDMTSNSINQGQANPSANTMYQPRSIVYSDGKLIISELQNHRVLIFNSIPTSNNALADIVVGQPNMTSGSANQGGSVAANTLYNPHGLFVDGSRLYIDDTNNNRVLIYNSIPTADDASADVVVGQPDMTSNSINQGQANPSANTLSAALDNFVYQKYLYVADDNNSRVLAYKLGPENTSVDVLQVLNNDGKNIRLGVSATGAYQMMISNYSDFRDGAWESYSSTKDWTLLGDGAQTVYAKFRDHALYESEPVSALTDLPQTGIRNFFWLYIAFAGLLVIVVIFIYLKNYAQKNNY